MTQIMNVDWKFVLDGLKEIDVGNNIVYGIPRGGMCLSAHLKHAKVTHDPSEANLIIDDIVATGRTRDLFQARYPDARFWALIDRTQIDDQTKYWYKFPWESESGPEDAVVRLLEYIGEDPMREGLKDTPKRVIKAFKEMTSGYQQNYHAYLETSFQSNYKSMIILRDIQFTSLCEHHLLPFMGTVDIGYIPNEGKVIGISKLARIVECFAKRLQIQEQMTEQIALALMDVTKFGPLGVGVIIKAHHQCMSCRGVRQHNTEMVTSSLQGIMYSDLAARQEFLGFIK